MFKETEPIELVFPTEPESVLPSTSNFSDSFENKENLKSSSDDSEGTLLNLDQSIKILPHEENPSDSESIYSEIDSELKQTIISQSSALKTPAKHIKGTIVTPGIPSSSEGPPGPGAQSTPASRSISTTVNDHLGKVSEDIITAIPSRKEKSHPTQLYETVPSKEPIILHRSIPITRNINPTITPDSLMITKDNIAHFISADCIVETPIGYLLTNLGYISEISHKEQDAKKGSVIVTQAGTIKIFSLICRERFYDLITEDDLHVALNALK